MSKRDELDANKAPRDQETAQLSEGDLEPLMAAETSEHLTDSDLMSSDSLPLIDPEDPAISSSPPAPPAPPAAQPPTPRAPATAEPPAPIAPPRIDIDESLASGDLTPAEPLPMIERSMTAPVRLDWLEEAAFLGRERDAAEQQPQRSGLLSLAAATTAERAGRSTHEHLKRALEVAGEAKPLAALVREALMLRGHYDEALELTRDDQRLGGDVSARVAALLDAAAIVQHKHADHERALRFARRAADLKPDDTVAITFVVNCVTALHHERQAARTLEQLSDLIRVGTEKASVLFAAGTLYEFRLNEPEKAAQRYSQAIESDPGHVPALLALAELLERSDDWGELCDVLEKLAQTTLCQHDKAHYLMRAAALRSAHLADSDGAARCLEQAARLDKNASWPLSRLATLYESTGQHQHLVDVLRRRLRQLGDAHGKAALLTRIGWILQSRAADEAGAIAAYREALDARPGFAPATRALIRLYRHRAELDALVEILHREAESTAPAAQRALVCLEAAELLLRQLERPEDAVAFYQRALDLDPTLSLAFWPLRRLLQDQGRHAELARLLEQQIEQLGDSTTVGHLLLELARLQAGPLARPAAAVETLQAAAERPSDASATIELTDLFARQERGDDLVTLLQRQAEATDRSDEAARLHLEAAHQLDRLGEHEKAADGYLRVLARQPDSETAIGALTELYNRLGRWRELADLLRQRISEESPPGATAQLWCQIGQLEEDQLGQRAEAISAYREALVCDPQSGQALGALERLLLAEGSVEQLVDVLVEQAASNQEAVGAADTLCQAAELAENLLTDLPRAEDLYRRALERHPNASVALRGLWTVQRRSGAYRPAAETLERLAATASDGAARAALELQLSRLREYRLDEAPELSRLRSWIADAPFADKLQFELLRVTRLQATSSELAEILLRLGDEAKDDGLATALLIEAAYRCEFDNAPAAFARAAERAAARGHDGAHVATSSLRRAYQREGRLEALAQVLENDAAQQEPPFRVDYLYQAATLYLDTEKRKDASRVLEACLESDPLNLAALRLRAAIARAAGDGVTLAHTLDQLGKNCASVANRLSSSLQAADLWVNQLGDRQRALASLMVALRDDPDNEQAYALAQQLFETLNRYEELSQLQAFRIERTRDPARRITLLREHAVLLRDQLNNPSGAIHALAQLLTLSPQDVEALELSIDLLIKLERWSDAARALASLSGCAKEPGQIRHARLQQATICIEQLDQPEQARHVLQSALDADPLDSAAKRLLVRIDLAEGRWAEARHTLESLAADGNTLESVWAMNKLADVARTGFGDEALRERWEREALVQAASDGEALETVIERFRERRDVGTLANMVQSVLAETTVSAVASKLRLTLAELFVEDLEQPEAALEQLHERSLAEPECERTQLLVAKALEQKGEVEQALGKYRQIVFADVRSCPAYRGILRLAPRLGASATAGSAAAAVDLLGEASATERSQIDTLESAGMPPGQLEPLSIEQGEALGDVREVLELVAPHMGGLYRLPLAQEVGSSDPPRVVAGHLARALGLALPKLSVEGDRPAVAGAGLPVPLQVSQELAKQPESAAFRFWVGRSLAAATSAGVLLEQLSTAQLGELLEALCNAQSVDPTIQQLRKRAYRALPRKVRKQVEQLPCPSIDSALWQTYRTLETYRADRMGLLLSGSPRTCFRELARIERIDDDPVQHDRLADLMRFAVSEEYLRHHVALWSSGRA
jgi:tetratricopeptide (TPR) repeat protein